MFGFCDQRLHLAEQLRQLGLDSRFSAPAWGLGSWAPCGSQACLPGPQKHSSCFSYRHFGLSSSHKWPWCSRPQPSVSEWSAYLSHFEPSREHTLGCPLCRLSWEQLVAAIWSHLELLHCFHESFSGRPWPSLCHCWKKRASPEDSWYCKQLCWSFQLWLCLQWLLEMKNFGSGPSQSWTYFDSGWLSCVHFSWLYHDAHWHLSKLHAATVEAILRQV